MKVVTCKVVIGVPDDSEDVARSIFEQMLPTNEGAREIRDAATVFVVYYRSGPVVKTVDLRDPDLNIMGETPEEDKYIFEGEVNRWYDNADAIVRKEAEGEQASL